PARGSRGTADPPDSESGSLERASRSAPTIHSTATLNHGGHMANHAHHSQDATFQIISKRRKGFPSETRVGKGLRIVHGNKVLSEKLGRNDLCPCGSGRRF